MLPGALEPEGGMQEAISPLRMSRFHCPLCTRQRTARLRLSAVARVTASACGTSGSVDKHVEV